MAKTRISALSKELEISNKEIIEFLASKGIEGKTAQSGLEENEAAMVVNNFKKKAEPVKENKPAPEKKAAAEAAKQPAGAEAPKKKKTFAVFNAQYSNTGNSAKPGNGKNSRPPMQRQSNATAPAQQSGGRPLIKPRVTPTQVSNDGVKPDPYKGTNGVKRPMKTEAENVKEATAAAEQIEKVSENIGSGVDTAGSAVNSTGSADSASKKAAPQGERRGPIVTGNIAGALEAQKQAAQAAKAARNQQRQNRQQGGRPNNNNQGGENNRGNNGFNNRGQNNRPNNNNNQANQGPVVNANKPQNNKNNQKGGQKGSHGKDRDFDKNKQTENFVNLEKQTHGKGNKPKMKNETEVREIAIPDRIVIRELADLMKVNVADIVKKLFMMGEMLTPNHEIDFEKAEEIALEYNCIVNHEEKVDVIAELLKEDEEAEENLVSRPPVVCVMGHVDHGKTSLLDAIRNTKVTAREAGGITQHIGAYTVQVEDRKITFLDTPGHEAFTAMRMRGASSTDIAILVVAADDGVMPQTVEAINHAKAAGVEIIVAINKIDKPAANLDKVKQELANYELIPEDWGGSTVMVPVSAKTQEGIDNLLDMVLLTADVLELKANPKRNARGLVIEAQLDKGRGVVATVLVQKGTLHVGDAVACGSSYGKVRAMLDDNGQRVKEAGPSTPVEIIGLSEVPGAGEVFMVHDSEKEAKAFAATFVSESKKNLIEETKAKMSLDDLYSQIKTGNLKQLDVIVKADVQGSVEAVKQSLEKLSNDEVIVKVIHSGAGAISESDVALASASNAIIIGFNVKVDGTAKATAEHEGVDVRLYSVIYNAIEDVENAMKGMLDPVYEEQIIGHGEIRQIFKASGVGNIAGSYITDGIFQRGCKVRITRADELVYDGPLASLKRFKDDVKEVRAGYECGLVFDGFNEFAVDDQMEAYSMVEVKR